MVKNPPDNAGNMGFDPWSGKIPHAAEQLSPCTTLLSLSARAREPQLLSPRATTTEAPCLEPVLRHKRSHRKEKPKC